MRSDFDASPPIDTPFQQKLAAINYGEDAVNVETKRTLVAGQPMMLWSTDALVSLSRSAREEAGQWWQRKLELEKHTQGNLK